MSFKGQINNLRILKNMLVLAHNEAKQREQLRQGLIYNPGFGKEFLLEDVPNFIHGCGYVAKKTKKGITYL